MVMLPPHDPVTDRWPHRLEEALPGVTVLRPAAGDETSAALSEADAAYGTLPADLLARAPRLRWLQAPQAGPPPGFYYPALVQHPVSVTNMRDTYTDHVAAHTLALILAVARQLPRYIRDQAQGGWEPDWRPEAVIPLAESRAPRRDGCWPRSAPTSWEWTPASPPLHAGSPGFIRPSTSTACCPPRTSSC
jgi:phosphoglycerate dehydrogenase-like enzyme